MIATIIIDLCNILNICCVLLYSFISAMLKIKTEFVVHLFNKYFRMYFSITHSWIFVFLS